MVKTLPCSGCLTACMSAHFHVVKLGYADRMTHCGMVPNGVADSIEFQFTSLRRIEVLPRSFDGLTMVYFDYNLCNKGDEKCNDLSIC